MTLQDLTNPPAQCSALSLIDREILTEDSLAEMVSAEEHQTALDRIAELETEVDQAKAEFRDKDNECDRLTEAATAARALLIYLDADAPLENGAVLERDRLTAREHLRRALDLVDGKPVPPKPAKKRRASRSKS